MKTAPHKRRDFLQNITIVLLTLSAVALFAQTQLYNLQDGSRGYLTGLLGTSSAISSGTASPTELWDFSAPVRVAITGSYGRYGNVSLTTTDEAFSPLRTLLGQALGSARSFSPCSAATFRESLSASSVYYDFLEPLPLSILAGLAGEDTSSTGLSARYLVVSSSGESVFLCLWDGQKTYMMADTAVIPADLAEAVGSYELTGAAFAFDNANLSPAYAAVAPYSLFPAELPDLPVLTASNPLSDTAALLTALGINPHTTSRYMESNGTEVIERVLRIRPDGTVLYESDEESTLKIEAEEENTPTVREAAWGVASLMQNLLGNAAGDAALYLQSIQQNNGVTTLQFGYHLDGVPIRFSDGTCAAEAVLSGASIISLQVHFRQYARSGETSLTLPLRQALAIVAAHSGAELSMGYADGGGETVSAAWLAD